MAHIFDVARDIILVVTLRGLIHGAPYIFQWVSNQ